MNKRYDYKRCMARRLALILMVLLCAAAGVASAADGDKQTAYVHATNLILRKQPKAKGDPITQITQNQTVTILGQTGEWTYVAYKNHKGYVMGSYLTMGEPPAKTPEKAPQADQTQTNTDAAVSSPVRGPDSALRLEDRGDAVRELQTLLKQAGYSVSVDGVFGKNTETAVKAFQKKMGLEADGLAGKKTLALLRGAPAGTAALQVEKLDWWTEGASAFPVGAHATVVDVRSGIRFTVKRWGGVNHADVEPLTASDSAAMKKAYNGVWSWDRRPIWVLVGNRAIAASMNGMPHMGYSIQDNQFDGHFCIHMKNSRTHGTNRVDEAHQAAVEEAYQKRAGLK